MNNSDSFIPLAKPFFTDKEEKAVAIILKSGWVTQGPKVKEFEENFAEYTGAKHACAVSSCTAALFLALKAVGVQDDDEVITVSHSFIATANSIRHLNAIPVFVDIDPKTFNMNPDLIEPVITDKTKAILCVHQVGMPCDMKSIMEIAGKHGLPVVEDAACAAGSEIFWNGAWQKIGNPIGDAVCFSFHPRKILTTGDGGMITTNNAGFDEKFRLWRQHSMSVPDTIRHSSKSVVIEEYTELGYNFRMTDVQAAIGIEQLKKLPEMVKRRRELADNYRRLLKDMPEIGLPEELEYAKSNWQSFIIRLPEKYEQMKVMQHLKDSGVATKHGVMCAHREPAYQIEPWSCGNSDCDHSQGSCQRLIESERAQEEYIILPLFHALKEKQQNYIVNTLKGF